MENQPKVTVEKQGSMSFSEWIKVFIATVAFPALQFLYQFYQANGSLDGVNWTQVAVTAGLAFLGMLGIELGQPTKVVIEQPRADTEAIVKRVVR